MTTCFQPGFRAKPMFSFVQGTARFKAFSFHLKLLLLSFLMAFAIYSSSAQNVIVDENAKAGSPASEWDIVGKGDLSIQGFSTDFSVNKGNTITFKIKTDADFYTVSIYRIGYYQGNGARLVGQGIVTANLPQIQPQDLYDVSTGKTDCSNWMKSAHWDVPANAVSGLYIARLRRNTGGASHIFFVVRDDASSSDLLFKTSDATWQAYNDYGGNSLYVNKASIPVPNFTHATKVSYDRPFYFRTGNGGESDSFSPFNAEYPMIRWIERNGYNVSYTTDVDMHRSASNINLSQTKVILSVGHDEYWSQAVRDKFENARNAGVSLAFFSGNEIYWKTRWEDNNRTMVCYKEGILGELVCFSKCDPLANEWTGLWRSGCEYPEAGGCKPENALSGQISWIQVTGSIKVPYEYRNLRFWRNTSVAALAPGETATLSAGTLGYEWDYEQFQESYPAGRITLSNTVLSNQTHKLSLYKHASGALVFGAGTIQWSWGLDGVHDRGTSQEDVRMQQATVNLFADMGVQPGSIQSELIIATKTSDEQPPVSSINISSVSQITQGSNIRITGTATDIGGTVAGIEVSVDGGLTWQTATGTTSWSLDWTPTTQGTVTIKSRASDDIGNLEKTVTTTNSINVTVLPPTCPCSIFTNLATPQFPNVNDGKSIEVGTKFRVRAPGLITGVRFYKGIGATGSHQGNLWTSTGLLLGSVTFVNETASGWQQVLFDTPIEVIPEVTYVVSMFSVAGNFALSNPYFDKAVINGPLKALANGEDGFNGVYSYSPVSKFPTDNYLSSNYWVDVVFITKKSFEITKQPTSVTACEGSVVEYSIEAVSSSSIDITWQTSADNVTWKSLSNAKSSTLQIPVISSDEGKFFRAVLVSEGITLTSSSVTLLVKKVEAKVATIAKADCQGLNGSFSILASGGSAPYSYSIDGTTFQASDVFNKVKAGTYNVVVKDRTGCSVTVVVEVQREFILATGATLAKADCQGLNGSFSIAASGGLAPYSYSIDGTTFQASDVFNDVKAGTYNVIVKDQTGCSVTVVVEVQREFILATVATLAKADCQGLNGSFSIAASGGLAPYSYSIDGSTFQTSDVFHNLKAGTYNVVVKDQTGCSVTVAVEVQREFILVTVATLAKADCQGLNGSFSIAASGGLAPYSYSIDGTTFQTSNVFNNVKAGTYNVVVEDQTGCSVTVAVEVQREFILATVATLAKADCQGLNGSFSIAASGNSAPYSYSIDGTTFQTSNVFNNVKAGTYNVVVRDQTGCSVTISVEVQREFILATVATLAKADCQGLNGSFSIAASGNSAFYSYSIDGTTFQTSNVFNNVKAGTYNVVVRAQTGCSITVAVEVQREFILDFSLVSVSGANCGSSNGSVTVKAMCGVEPYVYISSDGTYQTSNVFSNLRPGTYTFYVADKGNSVVSLANVVVSEISNLKLVASSVVNETCNGKDGSITVTASGTKGYQYSLNAGPFQTSNIFNKLSAGVYSITVKDRTGCTRTVNVTLTSVQSNLALRLATLVNASCAGGGGSITVSASLGSGSYLYKLNEGTYQGNQTFTGLNAGTYKVSVKDLKGCEVTLSNIVVGTTPFLVTLGDKIDVSCKGADGSITLAPTGGQTPYQFSVNGGTYTSDIRVLSNLRAGNYNIVVKENRGCIAVLPTVTIAIAPDLNATVTSTNACKNINNGTITVTATGGIPPYQYSLNGGGYRTSNVFSSLSPNKYSITVRDAKGCVRTISDITIIKLNIRCSGRGTGLEATGVLSSEEEFVTDSKVKLVPSLSIRPNPTSGAFNLTVKGFGGGKATVKVMDALGRQVVTPISILSIDGTSVPIDLSNLSKGIYYVQVLTEKQNLMQKVLVQ